MNNSVSIKKFEYNLQKSCSCFKLQLLISRPPPPIAVPMFILRIDELIASVKVDGVHGGGCPVPGQGQAEEDAAHHTLGCAASCRLLSHCQGR